jgi:translation initiation factor IF-3
VARVKQGAEIPRGEVWLFDAEGIDLGFVPSAEAQRLADSQGLDLLRLDMLSSPPRYGLRDAAAAQAAAARASRVARGESKELRLRADTGKADIETRRKHAASLLAAGYSVKLRVELDAGRGRDPAPARALLAQLVVALAPVGRPAKKPQAEKGAVAVTLLPT